MKLIKKAMNKVPNDWIFKILSTTLTTTFTFYLFQYIRTLDFVHNLWEMNEKNYIRSFLVLQIIVGIAFYGLLSASISFLYKKRFCVRYEEINRQPSISELREFSKVKTFLIRFFSIKLSNMKIENGEAEITSFVDFNKASELEDLCLTLGKWTTLFFQLALTSVLVWKLDSLYIVPLLLLVLFFIIMFGIAVSWVIKNIELMEKIRIGVLNRMSSNLKKTS